MGDRWMADLRLTRVVATFVPETPWTLPACPGVPVRGALEAQLRRVVCVGCDSSGHRPGCLIDTWWRLPAHQSPLWWLRVDPAGGATVGPDRPLVVTWWCIGGPPRHTALIEALVGMERAGIGGRPHRLDAIVAYGQGAPARVYRDGRTMGVWPDPAPLTRHVASPGTGDAWVRLQSPFQAPRGAESPPSAADWLRAAMLRVKAVARDHGTPLQVRWDLEARAEAELHWVRAHRDPVSQPGRHDLSGWVGTYRLQAEDAERLSDLLVAAEVFGAGRGGTRALGAIDVQWEHKRAVPTAPEPSSD